MYTRWTYEKERPWDSETPLLKMMDEEENDDGDVERGDPLAQPDEVERERRILRGLLGDAPVASC